MGLNSGKCLICWIHDMETTGLSFVVDFRAFSLVDIDKEL
jgi:hypothetical protein